ncbi:hypothetical protein COO60DRAFT_1551312, partial [Scenedesmus sp. NREL 46B-D3]
ILALVPAAALLLLVEACLACLMRMASARGAAAPLTLRCSAAAWTSIGPANDGCERIQVSSSVLSTSCAWSGLQDRCCKLWPCRTWSTCNVARCKPRPDAGVLVEETRLPKWALGV